MADLLLELYGEEIPARMQARAADDLTRLLSAALKKEGLSFDTAQSYVTPRRLSVSIEGLPVAGGDICEERRGPKVGAPEQALNGFMKSAGVDSIDACEERDGYYYVKIEKKGAKTAEVLAALIEGALHGFPWPKSMRWGDSQITWVRPLQSILCLFDGAEVSLEFAGHSAGTKTRGHRFLAPDAFDVTGFADYAKKLEKAFVVLDPQARRKKILDGAEKLAKAEGLTLRDDEGLLAEVTGLVEWPVPLMGAIDDAFMDVPDEVLIAEMRYHQKYFSCLNPDGSLASKFIFVADMVADDKGKAIITGNERVLRARLSDARFFWDQDRKTRLEERVSALAGQVFHAKLGTVEQKVGRMEALALNICQYIPDTPKENVRRAAYLAKADLTTGMVGEFPELQGVMGGHYARHEGEDEQVARAIAEHYRPQGPGDVCPSDPVSICVSLADKVDTLAGFFAIGETPTGSKDPFALRRAALGVIRLILENAHRLPLLAIFDGALKGYGDALDIGDRDISGELLGFFADRLKVHLKEEGVDHDHISAIFDLGGEDDLTRLMARVAALGDFLKSDDGGNLLIAYRRAANILAIEEKKDAKSYAGQSDASLLSEEAEKTLSDALGEVARESGQSARKEDFAAAMKALSSLRGPVDAFFDEVTVNCDAAQLRENRLKLLSQIRDTMGVLADFSKIEG